ncbi:hypothetical protein WSM22_32730 [Cytophagales bacterium WSM2-2]|nr:hypothetical protein WSM22_32730 [Cytophagales bacterium WSM2-2]
MLSGLLFLTLIILGIGIFSVCLFDSAKRISESHQRINRLHVLTLGLVKADIDFFDFETTNEAYFVSRTSKFLIARDSLARIIANELQLSLQPGRENTYRLVREQLHALRNSYQKYDSTFKKLEDLVFKRGYKDFGLEGAMRDHAQELEIPEILPEVLSLRKYEKDFLPRHDMSYVGLFEKQSKALLLRLEKEKKEKLAHHLKRYSEIFAELVELEKTIGLGNGSGIRNDLRVLAADFNQQYLWLSAKSAERYNAIQTDARLFYILTIAGALIFLFLAGVKITTWLSEPIAKLSKLANVTGESPFTTQTVDMKGAPFEIKMLADSYVKLIKQSREQVNEIQEKSALLILHNEELNKVNKELDNFLYSTAHDLRSPLASLSGIARLLKIENRQQNLNTYLEMIQDSIQRQESFIAQIVSYSKNKKLEVIPELLNLQKIAEDVFREKEFIEGSSNIEKRIIYYCDIPFYSDHNRVQMILSNLVSNGIQFADPDKTNQYIELKITVNDAEAAIEYSDNGLGIAQEHIPRIFNMFYRASAHSKGSGLGLFLLREAVNKLEGSITVESGEKAGARFTIKLRNLGIRLKQMDHEEYLLMH